MIESTSRIAYLEMLQSGKLDTELKQVKFVLSINDKLTSAEIAHVTGLSRHHVASRLSDALKDNQVEKHDKRVCSVSGRMCVTWGLTE